MKAIAQTTMIGACLAVLVYIATITTGNFSLQNTSDSVLSQQSEIDNALHKQVSTNLGYSHKHRPIEHHKNVLNGLNLNTSEFILLYDSTPYASKGHIALNLPYEPNTPNNPLFQVLVGRAPDMVPTTMGYLEPISSPPQMCISCSVWVRKTCYRRNSEEHIRKTHQFNEPSFCGDNYS